QRIVLLAPAQHLDRAADLDLTTDERVDFAFAGLLVQVDTVGFQRVTLLLGIIARFRIGILLDPANRPRFRQARPLGDAVADIVYRVITRHILFLQEIRGMTLALGKDRNENIGAGDLLATRRLHVNHRALNDALEAGRGL